ncbi:SDR family oxidoreductase [Saliniramus sp.]|uniref:SDR family oxidoreductase n=1 Tax=Saliniramus sp. TaxID=2986772 RepID=UPI002C6A6F41|nr:SDR family NAD(P)-dependent oxidoreductase [Saliniramus sp.]HMB11662.1 SDR family NAD(P)-dependent oxidoreductase [Saliniramus sp.]
MHNQSLAGRDFKKIAITGVSQGLGRALAKAFMAQGVTVFGGVRKLPAAAHADGSWGAPHRIMEANVTDEAALGAFAHEACAQAVPDIVIANAGIINERAAAWTIPVDTWRDVLDVNTLGIVRTLRAFMPAFLARGSGLFIAISSGWGREATRGLGPYCASKFAVEGLVGSLQTELPGQIRAVALDPGGGINTGMLAACLPGENADYPTPEAWGAHAARFITEGIFATGAAGSLTVPPVPAGHGGKNG